MFLCRTYELGDLSLTYPIVRSAPIFVLLMGLVFLKEAPSLLASIGIFMVILGMQIINLKRLSLKIFFTPFKHLEKGAISFAVLTAFSSACYSVVDKKGALAMHPVLFFYLFFSISGFLFLGYLFFLDVKRRRRYFEILKKDKLSIAIAALLEFSSYILILYAFCISKVAYVIALRQISVVFGVLFGILFLKEGYGKPRIVGSIVISLGVFLISAFG
jgi:drug/metabolite transporter (DMT)-like permease